MRNKKAKALGTIIALFMFGCSRTPDMSWKYLLQEHNGHVVWDMTGLCLVFEGVQSPLLGGAGEMQIYAHSGPWLPCFSTDGPFSSGGGGGSPGDAGYHREFYDMKTGVNTLTFRDQEIQVRQRGTVVAVRGVEFSLAGKPKQTVIIPLRGQPTIRDFRPTDSSGTRLGELPVNVIETTPSR